MQVITVAGAKGGCGKTTIAAALAARAAQDSLRVAMFDLNADQANLHQWWISRGQPMNPRLVTDIEDVVREAEFLRQHGFEWLIVDTPPLDMDVIEAAVMIANVVIIPVRTSIFDVAVVTPVVEMCRAHRKRFAFLLSAVDNRASSVLAQTIAALTDDGPIMASRISYRIPYMKALIAGKSGPEIDKSLEPEINGLWGEIKHLLRPADSLRERAAND